jgi:putative transposase
MPRYRREYMPSSTSFFTVNLLERRRRLLVDHVDDLRASFRAARIAQSFEVIAIVVLPEHLYCVWLLP